MRQNATSSPVSVTKTVDCSTEQLWALVSAPGNLNHAHPFCKTNEVLAWEKGDHRDRLVYINGRTYVRVFQTWNSGKGYTLLIGEEDGPQSYVVWTIQATKTGGSTLTITVHPYLLANWPKLLSFLPYRLWIVPKMRRYLRSVTAGFAHVATTGEPVPRNHFGRHSWFS